MVDPRKPHTVLASSLLLAEGVRRLLFYPVACIADAAQCIADAAQWIADSLADACEWWIQLTQPILGRIRQRIDD